jgi:hypothetical protein
MMPELVISGKKCDIPGFSGCRLQQADIPNPRRHDLSH